jgi:hypothetical protein
LSALVVDLSTGPHVWWAPLIKASTEAGGLFDPLAGELLAFSARNRRIKAKPAVGTVFAPKYSVKNKNFYPLYH